MDFSPVELKVIGPNLSENVNLKHPMMVVVRDNHLYISDHNVIHIVNLADLTLVNSIRYNNEYILGMYIEEDFIVGIDHTHNRILKITPTESTRIDSVTLIFPVSLIKDHLNRYWVTDRDNNRLCIFNEDFELLDTIGSVGREPGQFMIPTGIAFDRYRQRILVSDTNNRRIQVLSANDGSYITEFGKDSLIPEGEFVSNGLTSPRGIDVDLLGNVWVADYSTHRILIYDSDYKYMNCLCKNPDESKIFQFPYGITVDRATGSIYIVDTNHRNIRVYQSLSPHYWECNLFQQYPQEIIKTVQTVMLISSTGLNFVNERIQEGDKLDKYNSLITFADLPREVLYYIFNFLI